MRNSFILLPLLLCATPAFAQDAPPQLPPEFTDPATIHRLAGTLDELTKALMNVRIGEARAALEGRDASPQERNMTVGDYARRQDPDFERHMHQQVASIEPQVQRGVQAMNRAMPAISQALNDAQRAVDRAMANMPDPTYPKR
jgi:ABC-type transporter Mla subunit MlaD